ncbi:hypothetical protein [Planomicrobium sp. CPCC 101110]|uniref:hypothetical protein n=1 Tax=Planomicrobium sp. CPCC 101110 TaxID=2599619 RepID=UPI00164905E4|nr:hypothetical protein [Planomicrobium sp. CPCC 101110]
MGRFSERLGDKWAVAITSLGFGLQHYSLGFPWPACIAFSIGGLNMLLVWSGLIF